MQLRIVTQPTGLLNGKPWPVAGEVIDVPDVVAVDLLNSGAAEVVKAAAKVETATPTATVETAVKKTTRKTTTKR